MLKQGYQTIAGNWLDKRLPLTQSRVLGHRSLFIFPNARGAAILGLSAILWLASITYQNNAIMIFAAFLAALMVVTIIHSYRNMSELRVRALQARSCHAGELMQLPLSLSKPQSFSCLVRVKFRSEATSSIVARVGKTDQPVHLGYLTVNRGPLDVDRICIESSFPLGLVRCWTYLKLDFNALVWPAKIDYSRLAHHGDGADEGFASGRRGVDDFEGLATYQPGDSMGRVAWKQVAAGKEMQTKQFVELLGQSQWLTLESARASTLELKLGQLAKMASDLSQKQISFGLNLSGQVVEIGTGDQHLQQVLDKLALYQSY